MAQKTVIFTTMPFTFSHPAIVLPLTSLPFRWYSLTGLVVGTLTPDFEYFLRMRMSGEIGHTVIGILLFDMPVGLVLTFIFHNVVRNQLFLNLPAPLASRLIQFTKFNWNSHFRNAWPTVVVSLLIGASSHIFWDAFTHRRGFFVEMIPTLESTVRLWHFDIEIFRILQHTSTVVGGIVILYAIALLPAKELAPRIDAKYWTSVVIVALVAVLLRIASGIDIFSIGTTVVIAISATLIGLTLTPLVLRARRV